MTIKGPAIFLAQFAGDEAPFDTLDNITKWASNLGYKALLFVPGSVKSPISSEIVRYDKALDRIRDAIN